MPVRALSDCQLGLWGLANAGINEPTFFEMAKAPQPFWVWALGFRDEGLRIIGFRIRVLGFRTVHGCLAL